MERALALAERGRGKVADHPLVGAVVVAGDEVVGEGWYEYDAVDHAEVIALRQAGERARGRTPSPSAWELSVPTTRGSARAASARRANRAGSPSGMGRPTSSCAPARSRRS